MVEHIDGYVSGPAAATEPRREALAMVGDAERVVLVEGISDQIALDTLAGRLGYDPASDGMLIAPMGGAHAIDTFLGLIGPTSPCPKPFTVLCDVNEAPVIARAFLRVGHVVDVANAAELEGAGCFVCRPDLEAELIRAVGAERVDQLLDELGDGRAFRTLQKQPRWSGCPLEEQLHRFFRSKARRMHTYARVLVEHADLERHLEPLRGVLGLR